MTLAGSREPRKTAGNRMSKLLDAEEEDEFYKTTYGGFNDVSSQKQTEIQSCYVSMSAMLAYAATSYRLNWMCLTFC